MACSSGRLILRLFRTESSSLTAASAIPTIVSASSRISSRSDSESSGPLSSFSWCSSRCRMKSLIPIAADYSDSDRPHRSSVDRKSRSAAGSQEDLARHLGRSQLAGAFLGEAPGPAPQEGGYLRELLARLVCPRDAGCLRGLRLLLRLAQGAVERIGQDARPRVAHERPLDERAVVRGRAEREERDTQRVGYALFQVRPDDEVGVRGLDAGGHLLRVILHKRLVREGVRVEEEVPLEVSKVGAAGSDLEPDLPREGVT